jgi:hypothetical protein
MRLFIQSILIIYSTAGFSQLTDREISDFKAGRIEEDSSYIYWLPYLTGRKFLLVQASNSNLSHKNELSADFKMKTGTLICAARDGLVIRIKSDSDVGGLNDENLSDGNFIFIRHSDESIAQYWHLQKNGVFVNIGDKVIRGQIIAKSGNTGYSAFPHLHFQVVDKSGKQILPRFYTKKGAKYLRPGRWHKSIHETMRTAR